jgi:hypothetical protein
MRVNQRPAEVSARCLFLPIADIECAGFMSTRALVSTACIDLLKNSDLLKKPPSDEAVAAKARVITCEWKAADQYDDNRYKTYSELVQQVMDVCAAELSEARSASDRASNDKRIDKDEFNQAAEIIKNVRNRRSQ